MELILRDFAAESFGAVVLSSVMASVVGRAVLGNHAFLALPRFELRNPVEYLLFLLLGVVVGVVGVCFSKVLYLIEDACDWAWRGPEWLRPAVGGLLIGALLLALPQMYGVGYPVLENAVNGRYVLGFLLILMIGKMLAAWPSGWAAPAGCSRPRCSSGRWPAPPSVTLCTPWRRASPRRPVPTG